MKALIDVSDEELAERTAKGHDLFDEMWNGVLHMNPPPSTDHQGLSGQLFVVFEPLARSRGLRAFFETGLYRPGVDNDWRVPDQMYCSPELVKQRGVEGPAELVVEFQSLYDDSYKKLGFYGEMGVGEVLIIVPRTRSFELFVNRDNRLLLVQPEKAARLASLGVTLSTVAGKLHIEAEGVTADI